MNTNILTGIFLLLIAVLFWQCEQCNEEKEVEMEVWFSNFEVPPQWDKIYVVGSEKQVIPGTIISDQGPSFKLPINTNADSTKYVFQSGATLDTLLISYKRVFDFQSNTCGFTLAFEEEDVIRSPRDLKSHIYLGKRCAIFGCEPFKAKLTFYP